MSRATQTVSLRALLLSAACLTMSACSHYHGEPGPGPEVARPEQVLDFATLYKSNCVGCHGANGKNGAAISLNNPVYIALTGEAQLQAIIAKGRANHLMPGFAQSAGGMLTDQQVTALAHGIATEWANPSALNGQTPPPFQSTLPASAEHGQQAYGIFCARCHGASGEGGPTNGNSPKLGSIVDPAYLALLSDQNLRSITIAGRPDQGMPDWRSDAAQPLTDQQVTDILAWIASKRTTNPGQPYAAQP